jgi:hypothetical protein
MESTRKMGIGLRLSMMPGLIFKPNSQLRQLRLRIRKKRTPNSRLSQSKLQTLRTQTKRTKVGTKSLCPRKKNN